jgi:signal transduction histidine kinase
LSHALPMKKYLLLLFVVLTVGKQRAQAEAVQLGILEDKSGTYTAANVYQYYQQRQFTPIHTQAHNIGFTTSIYWISATLSEDASDINKLVVGSPHINILEYYELQHGVPVRLYLTGDHQPFSSRPFFSKDFVFPMTSGHTYLLKIDKRHEALSFHIRTISTQQFYDDYLQENLVNGILSGIILVMILFGAFLYISVRERLYLFYILYVAGLWLWVMADKGYGFQYLWPDSTYFASRSRPIFSLLTNAAALKFMQCFIGQTASSRWFRPVQILQYVLIFLALLLLIPVPYAAVPSAITVLMIVAVIMALSTFTLVIISLTTAIRQGNRQALFYLMAIVVLFTFVYLEAFSHAGYFTQSGSYLSQYGILTGAVTEAVVLMFGLAHRFNQYKRTQEQLLITVNQQQKDLTRRIVVSQEEERQQVAEKLHDEVGSMLSVARLNLSSVIEKSPFIDDHNRQRLLKTSEVLDNTASLIRQMSHSLMPVAIEHYGIKKALEDFIHGINIADKLYVELVIVGFDDVRQYPLAFQVHLYRIIQELLNNTIKHASASNALLQLIEHPQSISLLIEDNGKGIPSTTNGPLGKGMSSLKSKIEYITGEMQIEQGADNGTLIVISIPTPMQ